MSIDQTCTKLESFTRAFVIFQGYEGSLLKVTSKNGKTASPVGFVTFSTRAGAEAAKQDLQVRTVLSTSPHHNPTAVNRLKMMTICAENVQTYF